jgi:hypothetical protein
MTHGHTEGHTEVFKDRLVGEPDIDADGEQPALEAMLGVSLDSPPSALGADPTAPLRRVCGALLSSPQFLMGGIAPVDHEQAPTLTPPSSRYRTVCQQIADTGLTDGLKLVCNEGSLTLTQHP